MDGLARTEVKKTQQNKNRKGRNAKKRRKKRSESGPYTLLFNKETTPRVDSLKKKTRHCVTVLHFLTLFPNNEQTGRWKCGRGRQREREGEDSFKRKCA